jgi:hypothetical protein
MTSIVTGKVVEVGGHLDDVIAIDIYEGIIATLDRAGNIYFWKDLVIAEQVSLTSLEEFNPEFVKEPFFGMGYPYLIRVWERNVAISCDHGVLVVQCAYLGNL